MNKKYIFNGVLSKMLKFNDQNKGIIDIGEVALKNQEKRDEIRRNLEICFKEHYNKQKLKKTLKEGKDIK